MSHYLKPTVFFNKTLAVKRSLIMYAINDYDFDLPEELIAQQSETQRDHARLLTLDTATGSVAHGIFSLVIDELNAGDVLVLNDTRVIPARLLGRKSTGGNCEVLLADYAGGVNNPADGTFICQALIKASKRPRVGTQLHFAAGLQAEVLEEGETACLLKFNYEGGFEDTLEKIGQIPLPPYIKRKYDSGTMTERLQDKNAYQTVYAAHGGAVAAPTAGLHFTPRLLEAISAKGVKICYLTLHVGYGTFAPLRVTDIRAHQMHSERFKLNADTVRVINEARAAGGKITAVGTTAVRTLEYVAREHGGLTAAEGLCNLFVYPGFEFKVVDNMITNFHLPKSTLIMLVSAFAGRERILQAYREAVAQRYRFFSYGDAMFIRGRQDSV